MYHSVYASDDSFGRAKNLITIASVSLEICLHEVTRAQCKKTSVWCRPPEEKLDGYGFKWFRFPWLPLIYHRIMYEGHILLFSWVKLIQKLNQHCTYGLTTYYHTLSIGSLCNTWDDTSNSSILLWNGIPTKIICLTSNISPALKLPIP